MIIDCAHYQDGRRHGAGAVPLEVAAARCGQGGFVWLGLFEPGLEELALWGSRTRPPVLTWAFRRLARIR
jgi:hypothetical protein